MGRAESTLPFSPLAYLHLTTWYFLSKWRTLSENHCPGDSEKSTTESWPCLLLVPEQRASGWGWASARHCARTIHAFPVESHISSKECWLCFTKKWRRKGNSAWESCNSTAVGLFLFCPQAEEAAMGLRPSPRPAWPSTGLLHPRRYPLAIMVTSSQVLRDRQKSDGCYSMRTTHCNLVLQSPITKARNLIWFCR